MNRDTDWWTNVVLSASTFVFSVPFCSGYCTVSKFLFCGVVPKDVRHKLATRGGGLGLGMSQDIRSF